MSSIDIRAELDLFHKRTGERKEKVRTRLIEAGASLDKRANRLGAWPGGLLEQAYDKVSEAEWVKKLHEYENMCDAVEAIREEVLHG